MDFNGVVLLDKPEDLSSNTALQILKRLFKAEKAGHAGTLDPMATGMLPICLGNATKLAEYLLEEDKCYRATVQLGVATSTGDKEGEIIKTHPVPHLDQEKIQSVLAKFQGSITQVPPMYSALKHQGKPLYKLAREGISIERKSREVNIYQLKLLSFSEDSFTFEAKVSKGTYVRVLGEDIAKALNTVGHLTALRRTYSGGFSETSMITLEALKSLPQEKLPNLLIPMESLLTAWQSLEITELNLQHLLHGKSVKLQGEFTGRARLMIQNKLVAIANLQSGLIIDRKLLLGKDI